MRRFIFAACALAFAACSLSDSFESMVTDKVVEAAIDNMMNRHGKDYVGGDPVWYAGVAARRAVYHEVFGDGWNEVLYASIAAAPDFNPDPQTSSGFWMKKGGNRETYERYEFILYAARNYLKDTDRLKSFYMHHKDLIVERLGRDEEFRKWASWKLAYVIPFFTGDIPESTRNALEVRLRVSKEVAVGEAHYSELYAIDDGYYRGGISVGDRNTYEWVERRRTEGGDALVAAWAWVLTDIKQSIR